MNGDAPGQILPEAPGIIAALLAFKAEAPRLPRDKSATVQTKQGGTYSYRYTSLDTIAEQVDHLLVKHGLVWTALPCYLPDTSEDGLHYKLLHVSGQSLEGTMKLYLNAETAQGQGSGVTYARRYAKVAVLDLVAEDDDDGQAATAHRESRREGGTTIDMRDQAKGLSDRAINVAREQVGLGRVPEEGNQPWRSLASVPAEKAVQLHQQLDAVRSAEKAGTS